MIASHTYPHLDSGRADALSSWRALLSPERIAVIDETGHGPRSLTFAEVDRRANRAANLLGGPLGIQPGARVAILSHNTLAYVDLFLAVGKLGAVLCPLNWRLTVAELAYIVNDAEPSVLFVGPECRELAAALLERVSVPTRVALDGARLDGALHYDTLLALQSDQPPPTPAVNGESPYCILYTSGTTGRPKGALIPHRQVLWNCRHVADRWGMDGDDRTAVFLPMFHAGGLLALMPPLFYMGGSIVLQRGFDAEASLSAIESYRCTVVLGVPTVYQLWLDSPHFAHVELGHVKFFITGGAPCPRPLMERFTREKPGAVFRQGFGLSEVGPNCFAMSNEEARQKLGSVGRPIASGSARIVDEAGRDVLAGEVGELLLSGPHVCSGYFRNPGATREALRDGWFHTGDMVRRDDDGFYYVAGRKKEMIISGGENVYAAEVEAVFDDHPAVVKSALVGQPDPRWGEVGVIVVELRSAATEADLLRHAEARLARYKLPRRVVITCDMPYTAYGKVLKTELRQRYVAAAPVSPLSSSPQTREVTS